MENNTYKASEIVKILLEAFENRFAVFSDTKELLENQIPNGVRPLSKEHANFLFFLISQDHGIKSAKLYERAKEIYLKYRDYFNPEYIQTQFSSEDAPDLINFITFLGVRYPRNSAKVWYRGSVRLKSLFHGDAREIFQENSSEIILRRIRSFYGFGPKIGGLLFRVFLGLGFASPEGFENVDIPVDIHDTRIAALTGIADIPFNIQESNYSSYVKIAQNIWKKACSNENINWLQVDRALWILGSKGCATERHYDCPLRTFCIKGETTFLKNA